MLTAVVGRNHRRSQRHQMAALYGYPDLRVIPIQLMDRRGLQSTDDIQRDRLMRVAAQALHEIEVACRARLSRPPKRSMRLLQASHASLSAALRTSAACSAAARMAGPRIFSRHLVPNPDEGISPASDSKPLRIAVQTKDS